MGKKAHRGQQFVAAIKRRNLSIYDPIEVGDPEIWIPSPDLEILLNNGLSGLKLEGLPLRTRSRVVKERICGILGYSTPRVFKRVKPRFTGQAFDTYIQKSNNLQIWNEEISEIRRYVLIRVSEQDVVTKVRVVSGDLLSKLDTTGTLTQKYQARCIPGVSRTELVASDDTEHLAPLTTAEVHLRGDVYPTDYPQLGQLFSMSALFVRLSELVGKRFRDTGHDQERNRGAELHRLVCGSLGYTTYRDDGRFPDVRHQLLEVKLQTSPTIDLGLIRPDSVEPLGIPKLSTIQIRHCDVRYAVYCGVTDGKTVDVSHLILTTGKAFFSRFPQFQGNILNRKLQIPLPADFFGA